MVTLGDRVRDLSEHDHVQTARRLAKKLARSYIVLIILGIVVGLQIAPVATNVATTPAHGTVAVIPVAGSITGGNAASVTARLEHARTDPDIKAVVLRVNSGGGGASASEEIYLEVAKTADQMPVVTSVDAISASGAYYGTVASDHLFVKPASLVGSIGVILTLPQDIGPIDGVITTGPNKLGADQSDWYYKADAVQNAFVNAVVTQRGDALDLTREEVAYAKLYTGSEAVQHGLADDMGGLDAAVTKAAHLAGLLDWNTRLLNYSGSVTFLTRSAYVAADIEQKTMVSPATVVLPANASLAAPSFVMLPRSVVRVGLTHARASGRNATGVIPDESSEVVTQHG